MKRFLNLLRLLKKETDYIKGETVADHLGITTRTLRNDLKKYQQDAQKNGFQILSKPAFGYRLQIEQPEVFQQFLHTLTDTFLPQTTEERICYVIQHLLLAQQKYTIAAFCDALFLSRSSLLTLMKEVKKELATYDIALVFQHFYFLSGKERALRLCMADFFFHRANTTQAAPDWQSLYTLADQTLTTYLTTSALSMTETEKKNLSIHLTIALIRLKENKALPLQEITYPEIEQTLEYQLAQQIMAALQPNLQTKIPPTELYFLTIHLLSKRSYQEQEHALFFKEQPEELFQLMVNSISEHFQLSFQNDLQFYSHFLIHLQALLTRLTFGLCPRNPLLQEIKSNYPFAYKLAAFSAQIFTQQLQQPIPEAEIGFLALHFALSLETKKEPPTYAILVVCTSGHVSAQLLAHKLKKQFGQQIRELQVIEASQLPTCSFASFDYIFSTVDLTISTPIPVIRISMFLEATDMKTISNYFHQQEQQTKFHFHRYFSQELFFINRTFANKKDVLLFLTNQLDIPHKEAYLRLVMARENVGSTEFGNQIALPHPINPSAKKNQILALSLAQPILWHKQMVKYVFLLHFSAAEQQEMMILTDFFSELLLDPHAIRQMQKNFSFTQLEMLWNQALTQRDTSVFQ